MTVYQQDDCPIADFATEIGLVKEIEKLPMKFYEIKVDTKKLSKKLKVIMEKSEKMIVFLNQLK